MTFNSRLKKLEQSNAFRVAQAIAQPVDVPEAIWQRAMQLLKDYSGHLLHPWTSAQEVAEWCRDIQPHKWKDFPDPIRDVVARAMAEAKTGKLPPDWITVIKNAIAEVAEASDEELMECLRAIDFPSEDYCLPPPYSLSFLNYVADEYVPTWCMYFGSQLQRGEISAAEHAAELAKILPPITRANMEKAVRKHLEMMLGHTGRAAGPTNPPDATATEKLPAAENPVP
jgi:hypothetical protein